MKNYLPIGSVVLLRGMENRTLIIGRCQTDKATGECYDYAGCSYPMGIQDSKKVRLFNEQDICALFAIGFQDQEEYELREKLKKQRCNI